MTTLIDLDIDQYIIEVDDNFLRKHVLNDFRKYSFICEV